MALPLERIRDQTITRTNADVSAAAYLVGDEPAGTNTGSTFRILCSELRTWLQNTATFAIARITGLQTALDGKAATSHTHIATAISDSSAAGRSVLTAATAALQRTALALGDVATRNVGTGSGDAAAGNRGIPVGGASGYLLGKTSATDFAVGWIDPSTLAATTSKSLLLWGARGGWPPAAAGADATATRNDHEVVAFDDTTQEHYIVSGQIPEGVDLAGGVTVLVRWAAASATTGNIGWLADWERIAAAGQDIDATAFGSAFTIVAATVPAAAGVTTVTDVAFAQVDLPTGLTAGDFFRLRIARDTAVDTATGDAHLLSIEVRLQ